MVERSLAKLRMPNLGSAARPDSTSVVTRPVDVKYAPPARYEQVPYEVLERADIIDRKSDDELDLRQRSGFHQLVLCTSGHGSHDVDFDCVPCSPGTLIRIHPGQVQRFAPEPHFDAHMLVWPEESHRTAPDAAPWYPGSDVSTVWQLEAAQANRIRTWLGELRAEQQDFDGSPPHGALLQSLLTTMLLRLEIELPQGPASPASLPDAYLAYRKSIETHLYDRPSVGTLAAVVGYSTRTLDRACDEVSGQTARQVLDRRIGLELRRLLTHTEWPIKQVAATLGFDDASNFSKFFKRHTGATPAALRNNR